MTDELRCPYIRDQESKEFSINESEGSITFNGYYYVEDGPPPYEDNSYDRYPKWLPQKVFLHTSLKEIELEVKTETTTYTNYNYLEEHTYIVEIYKRVTHKSTNEYSTLEDDTEICFFPTDLQTLYFRIIEKLK
jgi:hypothetical protein